MKPTLSAVNRLAKAIIKHHPIPTNRFWGKDRIHLVPVKSIMRSEGKYTAYRQKKDIASMLGLVQSEPGRSDLIKSSSDRINSLRRAIKAKKHNSIPPIHVTISPFRGGTKDYVLLDGHHRLTAHQAEGKKYIRAVIKHPNDHMGTEHLK